MAAGINGGIIFRQLFERVSCTYTYIVGCAATRQAAIIDPVMETVKRDVKLMKELDLDLRYGLNTHIHADHVTGTGHLVKHFPAMKSVLSLHSGGKADISVDHRQILPLGKQNIQVRLTPGHTNGCATYVLNEHGIAFTGDALLFRGCGRTDFQQGDAAILYESIWTEILSLPHDFVLYFGHNYDGHSMTTVAEEKKYNKRLIYGKNKFIDIMHALHLAYPKQIDIALPANLKNGEI